MIFLVDTSIITAGRLRPLVERCAVHGHRVEVPALVHAEYLFQLRRDKGAGFDPTVVQVFFERYPGVLAVAPLDEGAADALAATLYQRFPTDDSWRAIKRSAWRRCLGSTAAEDSASKRNCGASVDIYLAGIASPERPIVTLDRQDEWQDWSPGSVLLYEQALARAGRT